VALAEAAGEAGAAAVLTAHTAGDQAETVLLRLLRGTGLTGLAAIRPVSRYWGVHGPLLVRPLLDVWPEETRRYCRERGVAWSEDETNASARFVRNRVRHELLPLLRTLHPGADRSIVRLAARARALDDWLDGEVGRARATLWLQEGSGYLLRRPRTELAPFLGKEVVARVLAELLGGAGAPGERQVEAVFACWRGSLGRRLDLGQGWQVEAVREGLRFRQGLPPHPSLSAGCAECWRLRFGETDLPGWRVVVTAGSASPSNATDPFTAYVAAEEPARLAVRFWRPGDRLKPAGLGGSKKLQDIFVDEKVERSRRDGVPLLFLDGEAGTEGECVWAVGVKRSRLAPATAGRGRALRVAFTRRPGD
jgi:tRNA(Ile)-lysidine synthase